MMAVEDLPDGSMLACPWIDGMIATRVFPDRAMAGIESLIYTNRICVAHAGTIFGVWDDMWCFDKEVDVVNVLRSWEYPRVSEPEGWHRHPPSNRRRFNGDPALEYRNEEEKQRLLASVIV
jgi:hypothetical protein